MPKRKLTSNPFNVMLIIAGVAFAVTAMAFGMMAFLAIDPELSQTHAGSAHHLWKWLADYGDALLVGELVVLAICTAGTIATDLYRQESAAPDVEPTAPAPSGEPIQQGEAR